MKKNNNTIYPILYSNVDVDKILFSSPIFNQNNKIINLYYENIRNNLYIQTPELYHFVDKIYNEKSDTYEFLIPIYNEEKKTNVQTFKNVLNYIDELIYNESKKTDNDWFSGFKNDQITYKKIIKMVDFDSNINNKFKRFLENGIIKLKVLSDTIVYFNDNGKIFEKNIKDIPVECYLKFIIELNGIWFSNKFFGVYLKPVLIEYRNIKIFKFLEDNKNFFDTEIDDDNNVNLISENKFKINDDDNNEKKNESVEELNNQVTWESNEY